MAKHIDPSQPLSDEDRAWLVSRNAHDVIREIDERHGVAHTSPVPASPAENAVSPTAPITVSQSAGDLALERVIGWIEENDLEGDEVAGDPAQRIIEVIQSLLSDEDEDDEEDADEDDEDAGNGDEGEDGPYTGWNVARLKEELESRELSRSGNRADLVARLLENDADSDES